MYPILNGASHCYSGQNNDDGVDPVTPSLEMVAGEGLLAIIGGADTTASVIISALYFLMKYPQTYAQLQEEVDKFYPVGEDAFDSKYHSQMPYLEAVM